MARHRVSEEKHLMDDGLGPLPPWSPDARQPWKPGQSRGAFIWPRDKQMSSPISSWRRWKDIFTGKGPPIYLGSRKGFGPTRPTWSGWTCPEYDNLGYRAEDPLDANAGQWSDARGGTSKGVYDFRTRRWTKDWCRPEVWSDVKWGNGHRRGGQKIPLYHRDGWGCEFTKRNGLVQPFDNTEYGNDFRYRPHMDNWDRTNP